MSYEATLAGKRQQVADCYAHIAGLTPEVLPVLGMEDPRAYRNKTSLPCGGTAEAPVLGFYAPRSHTVIPAASCPNAMAPAPEIAEAFLAWMRKNRIAPYREESHTGLVRHLVIRVNRKGESMVTVAVNGRVHPQYSMVAVYSLVESTSIVSDKGSEEATVLASQETLRSKSRTGRM